MTIEVIGDQLVLSGPVVGIELPQVRKALAQNPSVTCWRHGSLP
jgi:hypothetical protein